MTKHTPRSLVLAMSLGGILAICQAATSVPASTPQAPVVPTVTLQKATLEELVPAAGTLSARRVSKVSPQVSGRVLEIRVDVGDRVAKDQVIAVIDPVMIQIEADQRKADLEAADARLQSAKDSISPAKLDIKLAETQLAEANVNLDRMKNLWEKSSGQTPSISKKQYDDAVFGVRKLEVALEAAKSRLVLADSRVAEATASLKQAEEAVRYARQRLTETQVKAPYDAVVTRRFVNAGDAAASAPPTNLIELQEVGRLDMEFSLPQTRLAGLKEGDEVTFSVEGGAAFKAKVSMIYPYVDEATRSIRLRAVVDNADGKLRPGMLCDVQIKQIIGRDVLTVPSSALTQALGRWQVAVLQDGKVLRRDVEIGERSGGRVVVTSGVAEGDRVVIRPE